MRFVYTNVNTYGFDAPHAAQSLAGASIPFS
jgi:hypothetical protein